ncbi:hypothetical protein SAMN06265379_10877 [Saccharicrinis carchari]|uniref:tRNA (Guanine-N1)-methyltransferase n=1 Tax=Saccharicrinis carchari TaxID=1168039 RepID=A0A521EAK6_SACCC|nr:tRNA (guanine-N1)-methyltransferase [Saccharicrinis carchari]SMO80965.1 hypothetical protein SAMN06265379_10877 [Saccharicrinis carchari]
MKKLFTSALLVLICFLGHTTQAKAQQNEQSGLDQGTLDSQFDYIIKKSNSYEAFQVVRRTWLYKIKSNTLDSVKALSDSIISLENNVQEQQKEINVLKSSLQETNQELEVATNEKDSFAFIGMRLTKGTYSTMVWTIIFVLILALLVAIFLFKRSNAITIKTKESLHDKQEEFDAHRKWALEREQTLARDLNKLKQKYKGLD